MRTNIPAQVMKILRKKRSELSAQWKQNSTYPFITGFGCSQDKENITIYTNQPKVWIGENCETIMSLKAAIVERCPDIKGISIVEVTV